MNPSSTLQAHAHTWPLPRTQAASSARVAQGVRWIAVRSLLPLLLITGLAAERHTCDPAHIDLQALRQLRVDVPNSPDCAGGDNGRQIVESGYAIPGCRGCGYTVRFRWDDRIEGLRPFMDTLWVGRTNVNGSYFLGYYQTEIGTDLLEFFCGIDTRGNEATLNVHGGDRIVLGYDTVDGKYHVGCFAAITDAELLDVVDHHGDILYERTSQSETNQVIPWVTNPLAYPEDELRWALTVPLDCTLDEVTGVITLGQIPGTITLRAYNRLMPECFIETDIKVCSEGCADGDGLCGSTPGGGTAALRSVDLTISMGTTDFGRSAGAFRLHQAVPSAHLFSPASLEFHPGAPGVEIIRGTNGVRADDGPLLQVRTPQCLAQVVTLPDASGFRLEFYRGEEVSPAPNTAGLYEVLAAPHRVWIIQNPDPAGISFDQVLVSDLLGGRTNLSHYLWDSALQGWELRTDDGRRREKRWWTTHGSDRTETYTVQDDSGRLHYQETRTFRRFIWGDELVERRVGAGAHARVTSWSYYDQPASDGVNHGRVREVAWPGGHWERYAYDDRGRVIRQVTQFLDLPPPGSPSAESSNRVTTIAYFPEGEERTVRLNGIEISHTFQLNFDGQLWDIRCQSRDADLDTADNLVTLTTLRRQGPDLGQPERIRHDDGTLSIFSSNLSPDGSVRTNVTLRGQPSPDGDGIVDGLRTVSVSTVAGHLLSETSTDIASGLETHAWTATAFDPDGRPTTLHYLDGTSEMFVHGCCGIESHTDRDGTQTRYEYDSLGRRRATSRGGLTWYVDLDPVGRPVQLSRVGSDGSSMVLQQRIYDTAGQLLEILLPDNGSGQLRRLAFQETTDPHGHMVRTTTHPDGGTSIERFAPDGSLLSVSGSAASPLRYQYGVEDAGEFTVEIRIGEAGQETEWTAAYRDMVGRHHRTVYPDGAVDQLWHDALGRLWKHADPDGVISRYFYNGRGELEFEAIDIDRDGDISYAGVDRLTQVVADVITNEMGTVFRQRTFVWQTNGSAIPTLVESREAAVARRETRLTRGGLQHATTTVSPAAGQRTEIRVAPDQTTAISHWLDGNLVARETSHPASGLLQLREFDYDTHGRLTRSVDARAGTTRWNYFPDDSIQRVEADPPSPGAPVPMLQFRRDPAGRIIEAISPAGSVTNAYDPAGRLAWSSGHGRLPRALGYDPQGRLRTLTTWQDPANPATAATTRWLYHPARGFPFAKSYDDGSGPSLTWSPGGRLSSRTWARGVVTTYGYDTAGDLTSIRYSDGTPGIDYIRDRSGRVVGTLNGEQTVSLAYDADGRLIRESYTSGPLAGTELSLSRDPLGRLVSIQVAPFPETATAYQYDAASRLLSTHHTGASATYSYAPFSRLVQSLSLCLPGGNHTLTRTHDLWGRLIHLSAGPVFSFAYAHDAAGRRIEVAREDGTRWTFQHDPFSQLTAARRFWSDGTPVAGQQFEYAANAAGGRTATFRGGNPQGGGLRASALLVNPLNQITARHVPGTLDLLGTASTNATVTINHAPVVRQGAYFWHELPVNNTDGPAWAPVTNLAILNDADQPDRIAAFSGTVGLPPRTEVIEYDADGNRLSDSRWHYAWDAENRLVGMVCTPATPPDRRCSLTFLHDEAGRRIGRILADWNGTAFQPRETNLWIHAGTLPVAQLDGSRHLQTSFAWGLDLSGSLQAASGVGGLLFARSYPADSLHAVLPDGSGNVAALVNAETASVDARFEYDPFGEPLRASGPVARTFRFRFATKFHDPETGHLHFGRRDYDPSTGSWLSRDPIGEAGGLNLYAYAANRPTDLVDPDGLAFYAFDGTNNDGERDNPNNPKAKNGPTNVRILHDLYRGERFYKSGVGTRDGLLNPFGLAFGTGGDARITEMMTALRGRLRVGDCDVDITGFSRGAAMAREFANRIRARHPKLKIRWMGLFDTVASFGIPGNSVNLGYDLSIPDTAGRVFHLTAMDEERIFFPLTSILSGPGRPNPIANHVEVAVPGAHSDIGGGYLDNRGLANKALYLMWKDGIAHKVPFNPIPARYRDFSQSVPHDSNWAIDKAVDNAIESANYFWIGAYVGLPLPDRTRRIYYEP